MNIKGWRTIIINALIFGVTAMLEQLAGVDWVGTVGDVWAVGIIAAINMALRYITTTPVGKPA